MEKWLVHGCQTWNIRGHGGEICVTKLEKEGSVRYEVLKEEQE